MDIRLLRILIVAVIFCSCGSKKEHHFKYSTLDQGIIIREEYEGDILLSKLSYSKDTFKREGESLFFENERLKRHFFIHDWNFIGGHTEYYANGKPSLFICHDSNGDTVFIRRYDSSSKIIYQKGELTVEGFIDTGGFYRDHTVMQQSVVIQPPMVSISILNCYLYNNGKDTLWPKSREFLSDWIYQFHFQIDKPGIYKHIMFATIIDSLTNERTRITDSMTRKFLW